MWSRFKCLDWLLLMFRKCINNPTIFSAMRTVFLMMIVFFLSFKCFAQEEHCSAYFSEHGIWIEAQLSFIWGDLIYSEDKEIQPHINGEVTFSQATLISASISSFILTTWLFENPCACILPSPVVPIMIVEYPMKGHTISTEEIRLKGIVFSFPLKRPGIFNVTPCWPIIISEGNILLPDVRREAIKVSIIIRLVKDCCLWNAYFVIWSKVGIFQKKQQGEYWLMLVFVKRAIGRTAFSALYSITHVLPCFPLLRFYRNNNCSKVWLLLNSWKTV